LKVALFQFATNAVGKVPAVFENMFGLFLINALEKAAKFEVVDLTPPPLENEVLSLTQVLSEDEVRKAAESVGAGFCVWGSLAFVMEETNIITGLNATILVTPLKDTSPALSRQFLFDALRGDVKSATVKVEIPALEDLVEEMLLAITEILGVEQDELDLGRIGDGLTHSDRAMVYFVYALRISWEPQAKLRLYLKALSCDPYFALAYTNAAQLLVGEGRFGEAMRLLLRAQTNLKGNDLEPNILNLMAVSAMHLGMWEEAVKLWRQSLQIRPDYLEVMCNLASAYAMRDMFEDAEELYREVISVKEDYPLAWFSLGRLLARGCRYDEAEETMHRYIDLCPGDPWAYYVLGTCLAVTGEESEAEFYLAKAAQLDPSGEAGSLARRELQELKD
jgi:tetratricopeptide (TPR) repeat protein